MRTPHWLRRLALRWVRWRRWKSLDNLLPGDISREWKGILQTYQSQVDLDDPEAVRAETERIDKFLEDSKR